MPVAVVNCQLFIYYEIVHIVQEKKKNKPHKTALTRKKKKKLEACNILNQTVNLLQSINSDEENVNTPGRKSSNSTNRLALPTSLGTITSTITRGYKAPKHWPMAAGVTIRRRILSMSSETVVNIGTERR